MKTILYVSFMFATFMTAVTLLFTLLFDFLGVISNVDYLILVATSYMLFFLIIFTCITFLAYGPAGAPPASVPSPPPIEGIKCYICDNEAEYIQQVKDKLITYCKFHYDSSRKYLAINDDAS